LITFHSDFFTFITATGLRIFFNDPQVLYFSVHRFHSEHYFPFQKHGGPSIAGLGKGTGLTVNIRWDQREMEDMEYLAVCQKILLPIAEEFQPDFVSVSARFNAAEGCKVTPQCFEKGRTPPMSAIYQDILMVTAICAPEMRNIQT
jgi:hypothetical protein